MTTVEKLELLKRSYHTHHARYCAMLNEQLCNCGVRTANERIGQVVAALVDEEAAKTGGPEPFDPGLPSADGTVKCELCNTPLTKGSVNANCWPCHLKVKHQKEIP